MKTLMSVTALGVALITGQAVAADYEPVTQARLNNPEPENWLMAKGNYQGWSYTALDQVNAGNVAKLKPVWSAATGVVSGHEAPAIVNDGMMFVSTPYNQVMAMDAATGVIAWRYKREFPEGFSVLHLTNRGVALYEDKVYIANQDCVLTAVDAKTGEKVWDAEVCDWMQGAYITSAPHVVNGKVMVGPSGGEFGVRGYLKAFDAETGKEAWTTYSVPAPGEPGHETWPQDGRWKDAWKNGGGTMWMPGNYDPENNILYWGVGNGAPWFGDQRPGDNLYIASVLAMNPDTGKIIGHYQYHHNDSWDWAAMNAPTLIDIERNGKSVPTLISAQRNGYLYWLDRKADGKISYRKGVPYVNQNVFTSLDPVTGRPTYDMKHVPGTGKEAVYCPSLWGGKDWPYESYSPKTGMLYIPFNDNHCMSLKGKIQELIPMQWSAGVEIADLNLIVPEDPEYIGGIQAWDVKKEKLVWRDEYEKSWNWGSIMSTGGNLIFSGGTVDRKFRAYNATSGEMLWEFPTPSGIISPPSSFSVNGKQYIAVVSGYGVDAAWIQGKMHNQSKGWEKDVPQGGSIWVFALED